MSPYFGKNFFEFFIVLSNRLIQWMRGDLSEQMLASDEIQLLVLIGVAFSCALVGTFLVLKRMTMLANSLSHTILLGIVLAYMIILPFGGSNSADMQPLSIQVLFLAALLTALLTTWLTSLLAIGMKLQEDASIGLVFTTLFALGIVLVTVFTRSAHIGTEAIMGNVDALHLNDLKLVFSVAFFDALLIAFFFKEFKMISFDPGLAKAFGLSIHFFNTFLMVLVAATCIAAFRAVGVLLVLAYLVGPVLAARLMTHHLKALIATAICIGIVSSVVSVALSRHLLSVHQMSISTAGLSVVIIALAYGLILIFLKSRFLFKKPSEHLQKSPND